MSEETPSTERRFLSKANNMSHGFAAVFTRNSKEVTISWSCNDKFSSSCIHENEVLVLVQAGVLSADSAQSISESYVKNPERYIPSRRTDGSFLIFDERMRRILIGRDRSQAYHMYWSYYDEHLYISTNIQPFLGTVCKELDPVGCDLFLSYGVTIGPFPLYKGLNVLLPGEYLRIDIENISRGLSSSIARTFWQIDPVDVPDEYTQATDRYGELLIENIQRHLKQPQAGVFLSGGSDSASVVGVLHKIKCPQVVAGHMAIPGNFDIEKILVTELQREYQFRLEMIEPDYMAQDWIFRVNEAIRANPAGPFLSFPAYEQMGRHLGSILTEGSVVFNGEMCILDQGFSVSGDSTRYLRRWCYLKSGRLVANIPPLFPNCLEGRWHRHRSSVPGRGIYKRVESLTTGILSILHAIGRPAYYYAGAKVGFMEFPGIWAGRSFLDREYDVDVAQLFYQRFFSRYGLRLKSAEWRQAFSTMATCWYSEASNFTMPHDAAAAGKLPICFPYSSVDLMDFAASCPIPWCIDKKIQKDMAYRVLSMPRNPAYYLKYHGIRGKNYFELVYERIIESMLEHIKETNYGPLKTEIDRRLLISFKNMNLYGIFIFYPYCLSILKEALKE